MKIGLVCPYNITRGGGVQEIVRALQTELIRRGHDVKILTPQPRELDDIDRQHVIFVGAAADYRSPLHTTSQFSVSADTYGIEQMLDEEQFNILHFHEPWVPMLSKQILSRSRSVNIATFHAKLPELCRYLVIYSAAASDTAVSSCRYFRTDLVYGVTTRAAVRLIIVSGSLA